MVLSTRRRRQRLEATLVEGIATVAQKSSQRLVDESVPSMIHRFKAEFLLDSFKEGGGDIYQSNEGGKVVKTELTQLLSATCQVHLIVESGETGFIYFKKRYNITVSRLD